VINHCPNIQTSDNCPSIVEVIENPTKEWSKFVGACLDLSYLQSFISVQSVGTPASGTSNGTVTMTPNFLPTP